MGKYKYDKIGVGYNATRKADPYLMEMLLNFLAPKKDRLYLDIGCGTGNYTIPLAKRGFNFVGVDPSQKMLMEAKSIKSNVNWRQGAAEAIPAEDGSFDGIIGTLTIHHWTNLKKSFAEINRVLRKNGRLILFTSTPDQMKSYWLNNYFPNMMNNSISQMPSITEIQESFKGTNLQIKETVKYFIKEDLKDCFLYVGKNNPEIYFDKTIRKGISSFSTLSNLNEINSGLINLKQDLLSGHFERIKKQYLSDLGDYLFININKKSIFNS